MKNLWLVVALFVGTGPTLFGNGGAWVAGIPATGHATASKHDKHTDVTIEAETLKIDLHPEYADVIVHYRMRNTGPKVQQDFFFPVERWVENSEGEGQEKTDDIDHYQITVDGKELKWSNIAGPKPQRSEPKEETSEAAPETATPEKESSEPKEETSATEESIKANQESSETKEETSEANPGSSEAKDDSEADEGNTEAEEEGGETTWPPLWQEEYSVIKSWKKSIIPFERNQTRELTVHYTARYRETDDGVSDDVHESDATFAYSLSPAATWKGPIGKGKIEINILHPEPEDVSIEKPKERFKKISDRHFEWEFKNLKPTLADDIRIVAHSKYDAYPTSNSDDFEHRATYLIRGHQYFLIHTDYDAVASSTFAAQGEEHYEVENIRRRYARAAWAEGAKDDGIGENITLTVKRPLPLYGIQVRPGCWDDEKTWKKNNRIAALEITLNDERTFTESIPDEAFRNPYLIRVRDYTKPVNKIKMVIKGVHRGTELRNTCISLVELRAPLNKKPKFHPAR